MSKPSYDDLVDILKKIGKTSRVESVIGVEWVNYPVEVFDELLAVILDVELKDE